MKRVNTLFFLKTRALGTLIPLFICYSNLCCALRTQTIPAGVPRGGSSGPAALRPGISGEKDPYNSAPGCWRNRDMLLHMSGQASLLCLFKKV